MTTLKSPSASPEEGCPGGGALLAGVGGAALGRPLSHRKSGAEHWALCGRAGGGPGKSS